MSLNLGKDRLFVLKYDHFNVLTHRACLKFKPFNENCGNKFFQIQTQFQFKICLTANSTFQAVYI